MHRSGCRSDFGINIISAGKRRHTYADPDRRRASSDRAPARSASNNQPCECDLTTWEWDEQATLPTHRAQGRINGRGQQIK